MWKPVYDFVMFQFSLVKTLLYFGAWIFVTDQQGSLQFLFEHTELATWEGIH